MKAFLVIDMQVGLLDCGISTQKTDCVVRRINDVGRVIREADGVVVFIQHHGPTGAFESGAPGWQILPALEQAEHDVVVSKTICDAFYNTQLDSVLRARRVEELWIAGWATDRCVDTTIRAAASREYDVSVVSDAHTVADRPYLDAASIIRHHNSTWADLIVPGRKIRIATADAIVRQFTNAG